MRDTTRQIKMEKPCLNWWKKTSPIRNQLAGALGNNAERSNDVAGSLDQANAIARSRNRRRTKRKPCTGALQNTNSLSGYHSACSQLIRCVKQVESTEIPSQMNLNTSVRTHIFKEMSSTFKLNTVVRKLLKPLPTGELDQFDGQATPQQMLAYQQRVGSINYASVITRADVSKSISKLAEFQLNPAPKHLAAADQLLQYLEGSQSGSHIANQSSKRRTHARNPNSLYDTGLEGGNRYNAGSTAERQSRTGTLQTRENPFKQFVRNRTNPPERDVEDMDDNRRSRRARRDYVAKELLTRLVFQF
ncbi:uncharacterized protein BP5553_01915 [Venustampulla echinocandica]|uniref:Uncharacterized protein n=1 Tax=Venustampulla echinocandica TaxID=2656787 RepID=A0A370U2D2_9HELO|nr:uncharacterized protein BP5553_01915 [Venustampulla echinocandica]RDL41936.1 hypothetical protein BP5553_01915 [Venustampulla echinocandica]